MQSVPINTNAMSSHPALARCTRYKLCDQGTNKKMEHSIVRSAFAIYEHERLLSTITQIEIMENHFVLMFYISVTIGLSRMNITHALKGV